jgi:hypothetical protein
MSELKVSKHDVVNCYNNADANTREVLEHLFGKEVFEFDYKTITSFEKACERIGISAEIPYVIDEWMRLNTAVRSSSALYQLLVIQEAINNGWKQGDDDIAYYPYWVFYSQKELDDMGEAKRKERGITLLSAVSADNAELAGVRGTTANTRGAVTNTHYGFPLCLRSGEMAIWMGNQFESLFFDYFGITVKKEEE